MKNFIFNLSLSLILTAVPSFAVSTDFNANGISDFNLYGKRTDSVKKYDHGFFMDNRSTASLTYGEAEKDSIIVGDFSGDKTCDIGYVRLKDSKVVWRYRNLAKNKNSSAKEFGESGNTLLYGCNFNGNKKTDIAYIAGRVLHYQDFSGDEKTIKLPRSGYKYVYCADVNGDGKDEFIGKKKGVGYKAGETLSNVWAVDVVSPVKSKVIAKQAYFSNSSINGDSQKNIIALDVNKDGKKEVGFVKNGNDVAWFVFATDLNKNKTVAYYVPRKIKATGDLLDVSAGTFADGDGVFYKGTDGNMYKYNVVTNVDTTFIFPRSLPDNIKNGTLATSVGSLVLTKESEEESSAESVACDSIGKTGNGFLWKGKGESYGGVSVALLPIKKKASSCEVVAGDNSKSEAMWCSAQSANPYNGYGRQHWRAKSLCSKYKKPSYLRCEINNKNVCWKLDNPCVSRLE